MASEDFEHHEREGLTPQPIDVYRGRMNDLSANDADVLIALETLISNDLAIDDTAASGLLTRMNFPELIRQLQDSGYEEQSRIITEVFAMAPLMNMWPSIRELRSPEDAKVWLCCAVDLALSEVGEHEACKPDEEMVRVDCEQSPFCPKKTVAKALTHQARQAPSELEMLFGGASHSLTIVRSQLELGIERGLITKDYAGALTETFFKSRQAF